MTLFTVPIVTLLTVPIVTFPPSPRAVGLLEPENRPNDIVRVTQPLSNQSATLRPRATLFRFVGFRRRPGDFIAKPRFLRSRWLQSTLQGLTFPDVCRYFAA